jgi:hypothetical protein
MTENKVIDNIIEGFSANICQHCDRKAHCEQNQAKALEDLYEYDLTKLEVGQAEDPNLYTYTTKIPETELYIHTCEECGDTWLSGNPTETCCGVETEGQPLDETNQEYVAATVFISQNKNPRATYICDVIHNIASAAKYGTRSMSTLKM